MEAASFEGLTFPRTVICGYNAICTQFICTPHGATLSVICSKSISFNRLNGITSPRFATVAFVALVLAPCPKVGSEDQISKSSGVTCAATSRNFTQRISRNAPSQFSTCCTAKHASSGIIWYEIVALSQISLVKLTGIDWSGHVQITSLVAIFC